MHSQCKTLATSVIWETRMIQYLTVIITITIIILRLYYICVCALQLTSLQSPDPTSIRLEAKKLENSFVASITWVELEIDSRGRKLRASSKLQQPLLQLYFISSCDLIAIGFKQDELCFSELFWYQTSSESCETATVSYKNCPNTERF